MHEDKMLWLDVSHYQPKLNYEQLAAGGVKGICAKVGQGVHGDALYQKHLEGAWDNNMRAAAYHWFDPMVKIKDQRDYLLDRIMPADIDFIVLDVEQYWQDWREWRAARLGTGKITKFIKPGAISSLAQAMVYAIETYIHPRVVTYTSRSFVYSYAEPMASWLNALQKPLWLAQYPYSKTKIKTTWDELKSFYPILDGPRLLTDSWTFWQFSGDKFSLPGTGGEIDLNFFHGSEPEYRIWLGTGALPATTEPIRMRVKYRVKVRKAPSVSSEIVGSLGVGTIINVLDTERCGQDAVWRRHELGWSASYWRQVEIMEAVTGERNVAP